MIKVENVEVWGFEHAIRGMRNSFDSWSKSDSDYRSSELYGLVFEIGQNDLDLMRRLYKGGSEHRKYLRQIFVTMDIIAPLYWWKEMDTYKIGTAANSCSTMHKIHAKEFTLNNFSYDRLLSPTQDLLPIVNLLNLYREKYLETKEKMWWWQMIQLLPSSYNQRRTVTMSYENVVNIIKQREGHRLDEWNVFVEELKKLPYIKEIMEGEDAEHEGKDR